MSEFSWRKIAEPLIAMGEFGIGIVIGGDRGEKIGAAVGSIVSGALGIPDTPEAVAQAIKDKPDEVKAAIIAHSDDLTKALIAADADALRIANETARAELASESLFVKWARPSCIWAVSFATAIFAAVMAAVGVRVVAYGDSAPLAAIANLASTMIVELGPAGAAAGIYAWRRSDEKLARKT